ncbi:chemotaxis response regulator protein-glutamate methylesterase [Roseomonas sp. CECT 9278]|uniref:protein-glutamate methylesterase/protein-glutamine glutaminase n=1 Tax=Roseomonas sp. CECT 9278 TaxID=2845823 RepID=UPI001E4BD363|nr:chemotaxis response regulator protein-glutamate methylesterase [Roseomonas sp. CECT 9278]CAH0200286.1 Protein-glutamate methylesterase/protein-glutamine glutaminase [Roseomonas sp. CECT 9278]
MSIRVLIVDDSALIRQILTEMLSAAPGITVVGTAPDPIVAREKIRALNPDVLTLDIEMPRMDGLTFLSKVMALRPMPVLVISTLTQKGAEAAIRAMELGAVDYVPKPLIGIADGMAALGAEIVAKVRAAALARPRVRHAQAAPPAMLVADPTLSTAGRIVAIGASTGGVEALQRMLTRLPPTSPALLITQHMPPGFTTAFARRLNDQCAITVLEATDGRRVLPGHAYIAPGARHLELRRSGAHYECRVTDGPPVSGHRPSVDVLFRSVAATLGASGFGIILTGMGRDGAEGLLEMRKAGSRTLGQNEASCLIYGMPKAAMQNGAVEAELSLERLTESIVALQAPVAA